MCAVYVSGVCVVCECVVCVSVCAVCVVCVQYVSTHRQCTVMVELPERCCHFSTRWSSCISVAGVGGAGSAHAPAHDVSWNCRTVCTSSPCNRGRLGSLSVKPRARRHVTSRHVARATRLMCTWSRHDVHVNVCVTSLTWSCEPLCACVCRVCVACVYASARGHVHTVMCLLPGYRLSCVLGRDVLTKPPEGYPVPTQYSLSIVNVSWIPLGYSAFVFVWASYHVASPAPSQPELTFLEWESARSREMMTSSVARSSLSSCTVKGP